MTRLRSMVRCSATSLALFGAAEARAVTFAGGYSFAVGNQAPIVDSATGASLDEQPYFTAPVPSSLGSNGIGDVIASDTVSTTNGVTTDKASVTTYAAGTAIYTLSDHVDYLQTITNAMAVTQDYKLDFLVLSDLQNDFRNVTSGPVAASNTITLTETSSGISSTQPIYHASLAESSGGSTPVFSETGTPVPSTLAYPDSNHSPAYVEYTLRNWVVSADLGWLAPGQSVSVDLQLLSGTTGYDPYYGNTFQSGRSTAQLNASAVSIISSAVPEPATAALFGAGVAAFGWRRTRRAHPAPPWVTDGNARPSPACDSRLPQRDT